MQIKTTLAITLILISAGLFAIPLSVRASEESEKIADLSPSPSPLPKAPAKSWDRPHIYFQIADESQRDLAIKLRERLQKFGYTVMTIQNVSGNEGIPTQSSELRFFTLRDSVEAQRIAKEIAPCSRRPDSFATSLRFDAFIRDGLWLGSRAETMRHVTHWSLRRSNWIRFGRSDRLHLKKATMKSKEALGADRRDFWGTGPLGFIDWLGLLQC